MPSTAETPGPEAGGVSGSSGPGDALELHFEVMGCPRGFRAEAWHGWIRVTSDSDCGVEGAEASLSRSGEARPLQHIGEPLRGTRAGLWKGLG